MLPDQKTIIKIDIGETETQISNELIMLYRNSSLLGLDINDIYSGGNEGNNGPIRDTLYGKKNPEYNDKKSITTKVEHTIKKFCKEECYEAYNIENIILTGGALELGS